MRTQIGIALIIITCAGTVQAQLNSILYTNNSLVNLNPSFAGSNGNLRAQGLASINASGLRAESRTFYSAADLYLPSIKSGLALTAYHENFNGTMYQNSLFSVSYAKYLSLRDGRIKFIPSLQAGFRHGRIRMPVYTVLPGHYGFLEERTYVSDYLSMAVGGLFNIKNFYFGASFYNFQLITRREQYNRLLDRYNFHASYNLRAAEWVLFNFSANVSVNVDSSSPLNLGLNALVFKHLLVGGGIQTREFYYLSTGYRSHGFSLSLGYDKSISRLGPYQREGWTAMATFNLRKKELRKEVLNFEAW